MELLLAVEWQRQSWRLLTVWLLSKTEKQLSSFKLDLKKLSGSFWLMPSLGSSGPKITPHQVPGGCLNDWLESCSWCHVLRVKPRSSTPEISGFAVPHVSSLDALSRLMICSVGRGRFNPSWQELTRRLMVVDQVGGEQCALTAHCSVTLSSSCGC